jgi:hypothetical protein
MNMFFSGFLSIFAVLLTQVQDRFFHVNLNSIRQGNSTYGSFKVIMEACKILFAIAVSKRRVFWNISDFYK